MAETVTADASSVKKIVAKTALGCGALLLLAVVVVILGVRSLNVDAAARKPEAVATANRFAKCVYSKDDGCLSAVATPELLVNIRATPGLADSIAERLGQRGVATPVDTSWSMHSYKGTSGGRTTFRFKMATKYSNDPETTESLTVVDEGGVLRVAAFQVNSTRLLGPPGEQKTP